MKDSERKSYVPDGQSVPEFTIQATLLGFILSIIFNAANAYLGLKIGMTISASIPSAIISMGVMRMLLPRLLGRSATILENNIVHTIGSNGESLAAAVIFTVPALFFLGHKIDNSTVFLLGTVGGVMGMLMMIPLRHYLMVTEHERLPFPEGQAAAKVLIAGDQGGASAASVVAGAGVGALFKFAMSGLTLFKDVVMWEFPKLHRFAFGYEISPLFVGVGYLVGLRITAVMFAGGLLGYWVLNPLIHAIGGSNVVFPGTVPIDQMTANQLRSTYIRYIGAGGVVAGGLFSLLRSMPDILASLSHSLKAYGDANRECKASGKQAGRDAEHRSIVLSGAALGLMVGAFAWEIPWRLGPDSWPAALRFAAGFGAHFGLGGGLGAAAMAVLFFIASISSSRLTGQCRRSDLDLPLPLVGIGVLALFAMLWLLPIFGLSFLEALIVVFFCFFFVAVSARMVGLIGTTNQPVSGMTITALLTMTLLFVFLGHDPATVKTAAIMGGAVVCIAIALSGDLSQDLKTAMLLGATPWKVQLAEIAGTLVSAVRTGFVLVLLYAAYGLGEPTAQHPNPLPAPQSQLMAKLVEGASGGQLPWTLLLTGAGIGLVAEMCGVSALALAIGLYLPITNWPMMFLGGLIAWWAARKTKTEELSQKGSLFASGLIAGDALMGIALAGTVVVGWAPMLILRDPMAGGFAAEALISTALYAGLSYWLYRLALKK